MGEVPVPTPYDPADELRFHGRKVAPEVREAAEAGYVSPEQREVWGAVGIEDPGLILGWTLHRVAPEEAGAWHARGWTPRESELCRLREVTPEASEALLSVPQRLAARAAGLRLDQALRWVERGFTVDDGAAWHAAKLDPIHAERWRSLGFSAAEAGVWFAARVSRPEDAHAWRETGCSAEQGAAWRAAGATPEVAGPLRAAGFEAGDPRLQALGGVHQVGRWLEAGFTVADAAGWATARFRLEQAREWCAAGFSLDEAQAWRNLDRSRGSFAWSCADAQRWRAAGVAPEETPRWRTAGVQPAQVEAWAALGFVAEDVEGVRGAGVATVAEWVALGVRDPAAIQRYRSGGYAPRDAQGWVEVGLPPGEGFDWRAAGVLLPARGAALAAAGHTPAGWSAPLPPALRAPEVAGDVVAVWCWGVGFAVDEVPWEGPEAVWEWAARARARAPEDWEAWGCRVGQVGDPARFVLPYAAVAASEVRRTVGGAAPTLPEPEAGWATGLQAFCAALGVECEAPGWRLAALVQNTEAVGREVQVEYGYGWVFDDPPPGWSEATPGVSAQLDTSGRRWVLAEASRTVASVSEVAPVEARAATPEWEHALKRWREAAEIPWEQAGWVVV